ncbi:MAG: hypothetical protein J0H74_01135 [Chitinophagaceae bacterium]|nr:hypothetical protein [Chitinophagaceae bacterium]
MTARRDHNNPWADKLQDIRIPDVNDAWKAMEVLLDEEMPRRGNWDRRRWALLILLLLLLTWICNCPGRGRHPGFDTISRAMDDKHPQPGRGVSGGDKLNNSAGGSTIGDDANTDSNGVNSVKNLVQTEGEVGEVRKKKRSVRKGDEEPTAVSGGRRRNAGKPKPGSAGRQENVEKPGNTTMRSGKQGSTRKQENTTGQQEKQRDTLTDLQKGKDSVTMVKKTAQARKPASRKGDDSTTAKERKKSDTLPDVKGWVAGIGLNQFFTVGQQQRSDYNSNGTSGGLSDYIPVPMVRYYFSRKLFVQMEAQINTPQYVKNDLLAGKSAVDNSIPGINSQSVLFIKKLFYFNVPLSVHFSPLKNLYVGTGIQYSRLTNGVGLVQNKLLNLAGGDSTIVSTKIGSIKGDSLYRRIKTDEFRLLLDLQYNYKRVIVGARYNQALSKFLNVKISSTEITQARNSSIQVYLRYILWDARKVKLFTK